MHPVILQNLNKSYGGKEILHNINLNFEENRITALIGRSGSGKSTILKTINGLVKPTSGNVRVYDKPLDYGNIDKVRLKIGYSVQGTALFPHMTVLDNITLLAHLNGWYSNEVKKRADILMNIVSLPFEYKKKYPYQLSGGEQQRVGICRAMMLDPKICLFDEAFGALDPTTKSEIHKELLNIQNTEPRTIILVTHDIMEAYRLADKIVVIDKGKIVQQGSKEEIRNSTNEFVKYFTRSQLE